MSVERFRLIGDTLARLVETDSVLHDSEERFGVEGGAKTELVSGGSTTILG
jgi:hypothetical protein